jgi:hypothetical protein
MADQHMNPAESVKAFIDCGAERALGHHSGILLIDEPIDVPLVALREAEIPAERFATLRPGQVWQF